MIISNNENFKAFFTRLFIKEKEDTAAPASGGSGKGDSADE